MYCSHMEIPVAHWCVMSRVHRCHMVRCLHWVVRRMAGGCGHGLGMRLRLLRVGRNFLLRLFFHDLEDHRRVVEVRVLVYHESKIRSTNQQNQEEWDLLLCADIPLRAALSASG